VSAVGAAVSAAVAAGAAALAVPVAGRCFAQARLARVCASRRTIVLTYDDGPGAETTPRLLDLLGDHGVRATFFALGEKADRHSSILDRTVREGHEVGCHSFSHLHAWRSSPWESSRDVGLGLRALAPWISSAVLFRPPHGKPTPWTWLAARSAGAQFAWWTLDSGDTWTTPPAAGSVIDAAVRGAGAVVLMHDFDRAPERSRYVRDVTLGLIRSARRDGLRIAPLGELLGTAPPADEDARAAAGRAEAPRW
jgi:peptidoglycan/xylan/chitin deacetylase (PgdA/CDA1 family)